ncbi:thiamine/thiamine pyrophosphate ABC transporter permease ThiP [Roseibaca calidilacus]|nr:thiamine/thiamine pyrophosphate ABC transporter permease ThiP [Roseibaca calidilacus]CUX83846.1 thiamine transport system permease protein [Roseibaca calidilacus]
MTLAMASVVALWLLALNFGALGAVALRAEGLTGLRAADWAAVRFTLLQAFLSALLSVVLAIPVARALARRQFVGRGLLITLMGAPFILPTLVAVLGLLAVFGRSGLVNDALALVGLGPVNIYGLHGVVLAHVFYNLPLATRIILQGWAAIPAERVRLAVSLGFSPADRLRHLEVPMLRELAPGAFLLVFLICLTSFAVALALGGGPRATTVELAIYQAFRFDFDMGRAAALALLQFALCLGAGVLALRVALPSGMGGGLDRPLPRMDYRSHAAWGDSLLVTLAALFLLVPLALIVLRGAPHLASLPAPVWHATIRSLWVALGATALTIGFALVLAHAILALPRAGAMGLEWLGLAALAASPLVIGTGLFLMLRPVADPRDMALAVTMLVNAGLALPFALRLILPALRDSHATQGRLAASLGLHGGARLRLVTLPRLRRPLGFAAGLTAALSMGDLGVILLFADAERATLPMQLYRLMQAYRQDDAAGAALLLLLCSLALFWAFDRWGRTNAAA